MKRIIFILGLGLLVGNLFSQTELDHDDKIKKAEKLFEIGQYENATKLLVGFIKKNVNNWIKNKDVAKAYFILANIYYINDNADKKILKLVQNILRLNSDYKADGLDAAFNQTFSKIKNKNIEKKIKERIAINKTNKERAKTFEELEIEREKLEKKKEFERILKAGTKYGIITGLNFSTFNFSKIQFESWDSKIKNTFGIYLEKIIYPSIYVYSQLKYIVKGPKASGIYNDQILKYTINLSYIEFQALFKHKSDITEKMYHIELKKTLYFILTGGIYSTYCIGAKSIYSFQENEVEENIRDSIMDFDFGFIFGFGFEMGKFSINFCTSLPLSRVYRNKTDRGIRRNKMKTIEIGYSFN